MMPNALCIIFKDTESMYKLPDKLKKGLIDR